MHCDAGVRRIGNRSGAENADFTVYHKIVVIAPGALQLIKGGVDIGTDGSTGTQELIC